jgi:mannose-1-phosphate guanylyltransferase
VAVAACHQAVVLVGGEGTRLRPITTRVPKPAAPVVCRPFIGYVLRNLAAHGVRHVVFSAGFLAQALREVAGDGSAFGLCVDYALEDGPLGTAGAIRNADGFLDDAPFLALNGDVLTDVDLSDLTAFHRRKGGAGAIYLTPVDDPRRYGLVHLRHDDSVREFLEKPGQNDLPPAAEGVAARSLINAGVYVLEPRVLDLVPRGRPFSIERGVFPRLAEEEALFGYVSDCYWRDIGTPASYLAANFDVLDGTVRSAAVGQLGTTSLHVSPTARIAAGARVVPPAYVDDDAVLGEEAQVGPMAIVGAGSSVGAGAVVEQAVVQDGVHIGPRTTVRHAVLVRRCRVGAEAQIDGAIVGEGCDVGDENELVRGVCLAPDTRLAAGSMTFRDVTGDEEPD